MELPKGKRRMRLRVYAVREYRRARMAPRHAPAMAAALELLAGYLLVQLLPVLEWPVIGLEVLDILSEIRKMFRGESDLCGANCQIRGRCRCTPVRTIPNRDDIVVDIHRWCAVGLLVEDVHVMMISSSVRVDRRWAGGIEQSDVF